MRPGKEEEGLEVHHHTLRTEESASFNIVILPGRIRE